METAQKLQPIYIGPTGWEVYDFSHSQWSTYTGCPKRFQIERVKGWKQKPGAALEFGKSVETSVRRFYEEGKRDPLETFEVSWELQSPQGLEKVLTEAGAQREEIEAALRRLEKTQYPERENWESMLASGRGLMSRFKSEWQAFPPRDPAFPSFKNPLKVRDEATGNSYQAIPDLIDRDEHGHFIADIKCQGNLVDDSVPGLVITDMQLRTQAAVTRIYRVALWNFCRHAKRRPPLPMERIFEEVRAAIGGTRFQVTQHVALYACRESTGMTIPEAGEYLRIANPKEIAKEWNKFKKDDPALAALADAVAKTLCDANAPEYKIQWIEATMPEEHAFEAIREEMSVVPLIKAEWFPRRGGVRFPDNQCTWCPARGLCMEEIFGPKPEYDAITQAEMEPFDHAAAEGL
jgi:PD-(D/E)XK nuclease superfamily